MRYRSFGRSDVAVSTLTLALRDQPGKARAADWRGIVFAALENGINAFEVDTVASPALTTGVADALAALERRLSFVTLRCRVAAGDLEDGGTLRTAAEMAERLGLERLDCLMLEGPHLEALSPGELERLSDLREIASHIGVVGDERMDPLARHEVIDAVTVNYSLTSPVRDRSRIRNLGDAGVAIIAAEACPDELMHPPVKEMARKLLGKRGYQPAGGYDFLHETWGWTAEQICLAYVLTEPGVTSIRISASDPRRIANLAEVVDRDVPGGLGAQVEMARFTTAPPAPTRSRRKA